MINNIQRDGFWTDLTILREELWSKESKLVNSQICINGDPTVYDDVGIAQASTKAKIAVSTNQYRGIGCYMQPPGSDTTPYRVKAYTGSQKAVQFALAIGYADKETSGLNDVITSVKIFGIINRFDDLVMIPPNPEKTDRPIAFGIILGQTQSQTVLAQLSVQRLATIPPKFLSRIS